jgi:hypothetical protein
VDCPIFSAWAARVNGLGRGGFPGVWVSNCPIMGPKWDSLTASEPRRRPPASGCSAWCTVSLRTARSVERRLRGKEPHQGDGSVCAWGDAIHPPQGIGTAIGQGVGGSPRSAPRKKRGGVHGNCQLVEDGALRRSRWRDCSASRCMGFARSARRAWTSSRQLVVDHNHQLAQRRHRVRLGRAGGERRC